MQDLNNRRTETTNRSSAPAQAPFCTLTCAGRIQHPAAMLHSTKRAASTAARQAATNRNIACFQYHQDTKLPCRGLIARCFGPASDFSLLFCSDPGLFIPILCSARPAAGVSARPLVIRRQRQRTVGVRAMASATQVGSLAIRGVDRSWGAPAAVLACQCFLCVEHNCQK